MVNFLPKARQVDLQRSARPPCFGRRRCDHDVTMQVHESSRPITRCKAWQPRASNQGWGSAGAGHGADVDRVAAKRFGQNTRFITEGSLIFFIGRRPNYPGSRTCVLCTAGSRGAAFQARSCWGSRAVRHFGWPRGAHGSGHYGLLFFSTTPNSISHHPYPLWSKVSRPTHQPWRVTQAQETLGATISPYWDYAFPFYWRTTVPPSWTICSHSAHMQCLCPLPPLLMLLWPWEILPKTSHSCVPYLVIRDSAN